MALSDLIVSLWQDQGATRMLCTGIHLAPDYILSVAHAFKDLETDGQVFVCLLHGKHGAQPATLIARHERSDAAILRLTEPIHTPGLSLPRTIGAARGQAKLHVIDPRSFDRVCPSTHSVIGYDTDNQEYVLSPQTALYRAWMDAGRRLAQPDWAVRAPAPRRSERRCWARAPAVSKGLSGRWSR